MVKPGDMNDGYAQHLGTSAEPHIVRRIGSRATALSVARNELDGRPAQNHPAASRDVVVAVTLTGRVAVLLAQQDRSG